MSEYNKLPAYTIYFIFFRDTEKLELTPNKVIFFYFRSKSQ